MSEFQKGKREKGSGEKKVLVLKIPWELLQPEKENFATVDQVQQWSYFFPPL